MAEVLWPAPLDTVRLQMDEIAQQGMDLGDAEFAYRLQLKEALQASAPDGAFDCLSVSDDGHTNEALVHNKLQASLYIFFWGHQYSLTDLIENWQAHALRQAQIALTDAEKASNLQQDLQRLAALEAHDQCVARWLSEVSEDEWDTIGDKLQQPISNADLAGKKMSGHLLFGGHVQGCSSGHAAVLRSTSGEAFSP